MNKKYDYVLQQNTTDCGIASIMTVLMYYGIKPSREKIINKLPKRQDGYTAYDLVKISKSYGINSYGMKLKISDIKNFPVIAHTIKDKNIFHFIVILSYDKKRQILKIMDPATGIKTISLKEFEEITTNIFLLFDKTKKKKIKDKRFKNEITKIMKQNKTIIFKTIVLSIIFVLFSLVFNYYLKIVLSYQKISILLEIFIFYFLIVIIKSIINYLKNKLVLDLNIKIDKDITNKVTSHILNLPYNYFITKQSGELVTIIEDIENFKEIVTKVFILSLVDFILIIVIIFYTSILNIYVGLSLLLMLFIIYVITKKYQYTLNDSFIKYKLSKINYTSLLYNYFSSFETIKNLNISQNIKNIIENKYSNTLKYDKIYNKTNNTYSFIMTLLIDLFYISLIFLSLSIAIKTNTNVLDVILFSSIFYLIIGFISNITESIVLYKVYETSTDRILDCLEIKEEIHKKSNFSSINKISFKDVTYKIEDNYLLKNVNLIIKKSEKIYITGESGIGKSTMMKLLLKYYDLDKGKILIDNINLNDLPLTFIRNNITYIGQNEQLFTSSILDNLKLITKDENKINEVCDISLVTNFLKKNNFSLDYHIEENASNLSGGEKKKIVLARGLLHLKNVLILDEVFNEISIKEERIILKNIMSKYQDKIIIMISHRNSNTDLFTKKYQLKGDGKLYETK